MSGIFFSLQRKQEVVLPFALLLLDLDLSTPEGVAQGRKLGLARSGNVNAVIVLKQKYAKTLISNKENFHFVWATSFSKGQKMKMMLKRA